MALLEERVADLQNILQNKTFLGEKAADIEKSLAKYQHILDLWYQLEDVPMNPETECLDVPFEPNGEDITFPAWTSKYDIWAWFESRFGISIARDLMGE